MKRKKKHWIRKIMTFCIVIFTVFIIGCYSLSEEIVIRSYNVTSKKLTNAEPIRIVLIADLHDRTFGSDQQPLIAAIRDAKPDLILLAGDIFELVQDHGAEQMLKGIQDLAPCFYVTGNHEIANGRQEAIRIAQQYGVTVLEGAQKHLTVKGQSLQILGIDDMLYNRRQSFDEVMRPVSSFDPDQFSILMSHRPEYIEMFSQYGFDLVVSGHTHGGQIRVPFLVNGFYSPNQGWFPKYVGGLYEVQNTTLIISRGLANASEIPRLFNPPEVVVIILSGE